MNRLPLWLIGLVLLVIIFPTISFTSSHRLVDDPLETFELADEFQIELIASEPLVADPVAIEVDELGRMFVAEMPGYPLDVSGKGRIRLLTDSDGDGVIDKSNIFADDIVLPTGLMRWKNGLIVTAPPDVLYLEDVDDDGVADKKEVLLTGFARSNPQHNFNKPVYGLDNWIYLANNGIIWTSAFKDQFGGRGEQVHFPGNPEGPMLGPNGNDRNVRFKPDTYGLESLAGRSQFGQSFDAWGHHFLTSNATPQFHEVIALRYLERNPALSTRMAMQYTPAYGRNTAIYPITEDPEHQLLTDRGMITSAAGHTYYLGGLFPEKYQNVTFIGEPVHNLVHVLKVNEKGATFEATRVEERKEFLASTDSWFRPVNFYVGPDGALYIVDYYRQIVEHPEWMDEETARSGKLQNGTESGRIYRVTPKGTSAAGWIGSLNLKDASTETLVAHLQSTNIWWRRTAQRLLVDRNDPAAVAQLETLLMNASQAETRLHALWTLHGLDALSSSHILRALNDPTAGVRENALILSEPLLELESDLVDALYALTKDPNPRVRFQLLCTLGYVDSEESIAVRRDLLAKDIEDPWVQLAALTTFPNVDGDVMDVLMPVMTESESPGRAAFISRIAALIAANATPQDVDALLQGALGNQQGSISWHEKAVLKGVADGLPSKAKSDAGFLELRNRLLSRFANENQSTRALLVALVEKLPNHSDSHSKAVIEEVSRQVAETDFDPVRKAQSIQMLSLLAPNDHADQFRSLINPAEPGIVQQAAVKAFGASQANDVAPHLLASWSVLTPEVRNTSLDILMRSQDRMAALLDGVEQGIIQPSSIGWDRTVRLMRDTAGPLKAKARALLSEPPGVRDQVVETYYTSLALNGDLDRGHEVFSRTCSTCHQIGGNNGTAFGPDLGTVRHWSARALLAKILKPERTIADGYGLWSIKTEGGSVQVGLIGTESPASIELKRQGQEPVAIDRAAIVELKSLNATPMPAGLERQINQQEMADLIAYLRFN